MKRYADAGEMKRELENYESVSLTNRYERLRSPQPWSGARRMAPMIIAILLLWGLSFLGLWWFLKSRH